MGALSYEQFVDALNNGELTKFVFRVENYPHYKKCVIERKNDVLPSGRSIVLIQINLTADNSERVSFFKTFNEQYKLFDCGSNGKFTLKQLWDKIKPIEILPTSFRFAEGNK